MPAAVPAVPVVPVVHIIDKTIAQLRKDMRATKDDHLTVSKITLEVLCREIETLERDVELAKQDWHE